MPSRCVVLKPGTGMSVLSQLDDEVESIQAPEWE